MSDFDKEFGKRIKELRKEAGITQTELGDRIGVSRATVANYEAGKRKIPLETARNIYIALGYSETTDDGIVLASNDFFDWFEKGYCHHDYEGFVNRSLFKELCWNWGYDVLVDQELAKEESFILTNQDGVRYQEEFFRGSKSEKYLPEIFKIQLSSEEIIAIELDVLGYFVEKLDALIVEKGENPLSNSPFFKGFDINALKSSK